MQEKTHHTSFTFEISKKEMSTIEQHSTVSKKLYNLGLFITQAQQRKTYFCL